MKDILIIGGGISGRAAAELCKVLKRSCRIVSDSPEVNADSQIGDCSSVIVSPGVRKERSALYRAALARREREPDFIIQSELAFGLEAIRSPKLLAVTGTNGKTSTVELTVHLLNAAGFPAVGCGNIGYGASELAARMISGETLQSVIPVAEVSSFQLEESRGLRIFAGALLNLESDHVDRYGGSFEEYCRVKHRLLEAVPDPVNRIYGLTMNVPSFSRRATVENGKLYWDQKELIDLSETALSAPHNQENLAAALELVLRILPPELHFSEKLRSAIRSFHTGRHRIEFAGRVDGVDFYNDSKATNPSAVLAAYRALKQYDKTVLILGGLDKGMDFSSLAELKDRIRHVVLIGECRAKIAAVLPPEIARTDAGTDFPAAVIAAARAARPGDAVLLSPSCASMDMFRDYADRGDQFCKMVKKLQNP